jgi:hypothetical protein
VTSEFIESISNGSANGKTGEMKVISSVERMLGFLDSDEVTFKHLERLDEFVSSHNLQNGIDPVVKAKLFELLIKLRFAQIASPDYIPAQRKRIVEELADSLSNPNGFPHFWIEKMDKLLSLEFRLGVDDNELREQLFTLRMQLDSCIPMPESKFRHRRDASAKNWRTRARNEHAYNRSIESGEWPISRMGSGRTKSRASIPYPLQERRRIKS